MSFPQKYEKKENLVLMSNRIEELIIQVQKLEECNKDLNNKYEELQAENNNLKEENNKLRIQNKEYYGKILGNKMTKKKNSKKNMKNDKKQNDQEDLSQLLINNIDQQGNEISELNDLNKKYKKKIDDLLKLIIQLNKYNKEKISEFGLYIKREKEKFEQKIENLVNENKEKTNKIIEDLIQIALKKNKENKYIIEEQEIKIKNLEEKNRIILEKLLDKEKERSIDIFFDKNKIIDDIKNLSEIKTSQKEYLEKNTNDKKNIIINDENLKNKNLINKKRSSLEFLDNKALNFYDVVIEIDSINKLTKSGWKINYNEDRKEIYDKIVKERTLKIGVLGINNVGKSYILGLISKIVIPTGYSVETKGISIKYSEGEKYSDKNICLLDSAGFETPLLNDEIFEDEENKDNHYEKLVYFKKINRISKDKAQTERFIEELIITLSDIRILVVGKLTRREQKLIERIKRSIKQTENNEAKSLIIIHNLSQYNELIEVENHINRVLKKSATFNLEEIQFTGIKKYEGRIFFTEKDGTHHYIMARQDSTAGNYYNDMTITLIKQKYNEMRSRRSIDIPEEILKLLSKLSKDIVEDEIILKNLEISKDKKVIKIKEGASRNIIECRQIYLDEIGNYNSISYKDTLKYSCYAYKEKKHNLFLIRLEIPGKIDKLTVSFKYYEKLKVILIEGIKSEDDFPESKLENILLINDNRKYGKIRHYIELDNDIELIKEEAFEKTGVYTFKFNTNNFDPNSKKDNYENNDEYKDENLNAPNDEFKEVSSGVYSMKFLITDISMKKLVNKYQKLNNNFFSCKFIKRLKIDE